MRLYYTETRYVFLECKPQGAQVLVEYQGRKLRPLSLQCKFQNSPLATKRSALVPSRRPTILAKITWEDADWIWICKLLLYPKAIINIGSSYKMMPLTLNQCWCEFVPVSCCALCPTLIWNHLVTLKLQTSAGVVWLFSAVGGYPAV